MPTPRKTIGRPRKNGSLIGAAPSAARGARTPPNNERSPRAALPELMREIGYAQPDAVSALLDLR